MRFSDVPAYKVIGGDDKEVHFIEYGQKEPVVKVKRPYYDNLDFHEDYWLTRNGYIIAREECVKIAGLGKFDVEYAYVKDNYVTHIMDYKGVVVCLEKYEISHPVDYDIKGNWLMFKNYCQHLGCCEHCSDTYKINILGNVKCYTKDELYLDDNEMVKFKNGGLTLHQIKHKYEKIVNFKDVKIYKPINIVRNGIMAYNGTTKVMLAVNNFDLSISWLMTTGSFIPVRNDVLEYAGRLIPIKDIQYAVILDDEVSHAYTKTERICFVEHSISKHYRNIENELVPWILTGSTLMHTLGCSCRKIDLFIKKDIKLIKFDDYSAIIEYTENEKTVKSVIDLVHNTRRYKFVETITPDNEHKTTNVVKTVKNQESKNSGNSSFDEFIKDPKIAEIISSYTERQKILNYARLLWKVGTRTDVMCHILDKLCRNTFK